MIGRNLNNINQAKENPGPSQKTKEIQNPKENTNKEIPNLFSIPIYNRFQILENPTPQTQDNNENQENEEIITRIFYNGEVPEELKTDLNKKLESRKIQTSNETTEIRNKKSWINFRNRDESQQAKLEEIVKCKIRDIGTQLKQKNLAQHKIDVQGHDPIKQRYYNVSPKVREKINEEIERY